jgi:hypothetical protein
MSAPYISSSLGVNALTSPCFSSQKCGSRCECFTCLSFRTVSARLGVFQTIVTGDPDYTNYTNTVGQNDSCGNIVAYSTMSARSGVFSTVLLTNNYQDYVNQIAATDDQGVPNLYDTFVSRLGAFSSIMLAPSDYSAYSTICQLYTPVNTMCTSTLDTHFAPYIVNQSDTSTEPNTSPTILSAFPFTTTADGFLLVVSSLDFVNTDMSDAYTLNISISVDGDMPAPSVFTILPNSTRQIKLSQKTATSLSSGTYAVQIIAYLTTNSSSAVQCTNVSTMVLGGLSA